MESERNETGKVLFYMVALMILGISVCLIVLCVLVVGEWCKRRLGDAWRTPILFLAGVLSWYLLKFFLGSDRTHAILADWRALLSVFLGLAAAVLLKAALDESLENKASRENED